jgi:hypothetical protein
MRRRLLLCILLAGCRAQPDDLSQRDGSGKGLVVDKLNEAVYQVLSSEEFREIDGSKFYGPGANQGGAKYYVSTLPRDRVLELLSEAIDPFVEGQPWADDYGQYHGAFNLKEDRTMQFAIGVSYLKPKARVFESSPEIVNNYESDIVYTPPYRWKGP